MKEESTRELMERASTGDREAFDRITGRLRDRLMGFVRKNLGSHLRDRISPEDILQETFLKAFQSISQLRWEGEESFFCWLCGIARNSILRQTRRHVKMEAIELDREVPATGTSPSKALMREERWERFREALEHLSPEHRQVIRLARIEGVPVNEIARRMDRSPKAVYQLLWRALQKLRESFGDTESFHLPHRDLSSRRFPHDEKTEPQS